MVFNLFVLLFIQFTNRAWFETFETLGKEGRKHQAIIALLLVPIRITDGSS
jgi:hypothetical protein